MSTKFTQQSLNLILNATKKKNTEKTIDKRKQKTNVTRLPDTKQGLKKIRHEIRYGRHERAKQQKELQQKKEYVLDALKREEKAADDNLRRNIKLLNTSKLKSTANEKAARNLVREIFFFF
ncbi:hypothetical protein BCR43DRAFT_430119 [Syncephalastrum racemosum]|uniref:rRNA-processing protein FYV7 n=1 Tax=Syncephalastrum racemosum TaxID=13706 RepID=A0A1X2HSN2_SYNRA|nr:hypothetical protein BCR43DRAFT_430119 [Syncephalastrum racemosum]